MNQFSKWGLLVLFHLNSTAFAAGELIGLGDLPGGNFESEANAVSADGSVVVGKGSSASGLEAFRWTQAGGMVGLGYLPGRRSSMANAVNADGSVVVGGDARSRGDSVIGSASQAFRWTQSGGMVGLGYLHDDIGGYALVSSVANAVNADGSVVVGYSNIFQSSGLFFIGEAFRWTQAGGMVGLGHLGPGYRQAHSSATGVNADGSVVVGWTNSVNTTQFDWEAFRWTQAGGMVGLGFLSTDRKSSRANAVNADGSVVVGQSAGANGWEAFRWTQAGGMVGLGDLPGGNFESEANAVSADGSVVVGKGSSASGLEAFRWTQAGGMHRVADWLAYSGATVTGWTLSEASGVSADGLVVVGNGTNPSGDREAYLARGESGLIGLNTIGDSLSTVASVTPFAIMQANFILHGTARGHPLSNRAVSGRSCFWVAGDWGEDNHRDDRTVKLAEVGACYNPTPDFQVGLGIGKLWGDQDLDFNGDIDTDGTYIVPDIGARIPETPFWFTLTGIYGKSDATINRGYDNAGSLDSSRGKTDLENLAVRGRVDWDNAWYNSRANVSPYAEYIIIRAKYDGYTETGGGFPARFDGKTETVHDLRVGANGTYALNGSTRLRGTLEGVHRFDDEGAGVSGQLVDLFGFNLSGNDYDQNWLRVGAGVEHRLGSGLLSLTLNATTRGEDPSFWGGLGYRVGFN